MELTKQQKRSIGRVFAKAKQWKKDPLANSIRREWRHSYSKDGEEVYAYTIFDYLAHESDEYINKFVEDYRIRINSPYDCTGKMFTMFLHWSRQPAGVVVVHEMGYDI